MAFSDLTVKLGVDGTGFERYFKGAESRLASWGAGLKGRLAAIFSVGALAGFAKNVIGEAGQLQDVADRMGITPEQLQAITAAAKPFGTSIEEISKAIRNLNKARAEALAQPGGKTAREFGALGMNRDTLRGISDGNEMLLRFSDALKGANLNANNLPVILDLIGQKNEAVIPPLVAGMRALTQTAREAGMVISNETVGALDEAGDAMTNLSTQIQTAAAPAIVWFINRLQESVALLRAMSSGASAAFGSIKQGPFAMGKSFAEGFMGADDQMAREELARQEQRESTRRNRRSLIGLEDLASLFNTGTRRTSTVDRERDHVRGGLASIGGFGAIGDTRARGAQFEQLRELKNISRNTQRLVQQNDD